MLSILPWQCCTHKTQMHSVSFLVFFNNPSLTPFPDLTKSSQPSLKNWTSCSFGGVEDVDQCSFCFRGHFFNYLVFEIFEIFWQLSDLVSKLDNSPFVVIANYFCTIADSNHGDITRINHKKAFIKGEAHLTCRNLNLCIRKQSKILIGWDEIC